VEPTRQLEENNKQAFKTKTAFARCMDVKLNKKNDLFHLSKNEILNQV
jgi:hypothetical protein